MRFTAGGVLGRALGVLLAHFPSFVLLALLLFGPVFVVSWLVGSGSSVSVYHIGPGTTPVPAAEHSPLAGQFIVGMLAFLAHYLLAGAVSYGVFQHLRGERVGMRDVLARGVQRLLAVVDVAFVTAVAVGFGFLLLFVPGAILACMWYVAIPAAVVERPGVFGALARSRDLTTGHRGQIAWVMLTSLGLMFGFGLLVPMAFANVGRFPALLLGALVQVFFGLFGGITQAVAYHDLRIVKEGASEEDLAVLVD